MMGQNEILEYLKTQEQARTAKEIAEALDCNRSSTNRCLAKLRRAGFVKRFEWASINKDGKRMVERGYMIDG